MKYLTFLAILMFALESCSKDEDENQSPELSDQDQSSIETMEGSLEQAQSYQDSLQMCCDSTIACPDSLHNHYDEMLHKSEFRFHQHHDDYEHNRYHGDHQHGNGNQMGTMYQDHNMGHHHDGNNEHRSNLNH